MIKYEVEDSDGNKIEFEADENQGNIQIRQSQDMIWVGDLDKFIIQIQKFKRMIDEANAS